MLHPMMAIIRRWPAVWRKCFACLMSIYHLVRVKTLDFKIYSVENKLHATTQPCRHMQPQYNSTVKEQDHPWDSGQESDQQKVLLCFTEPILNTSILTLQHNTWNRFVILWSQPWLTKTCQGSILLLGNNIALDTDTVDVPLVCDQWQWHLDSYTQLIKILLWTEYVRTIKMLGFTLLLDGGHFDYIVSC
jgi:hypothetical protein